MQRYDLNDLKNVMKRLRDPDTGCPWDVRQTIESLQPFILEETYEVISAIIKSDFNNLSEELGDLLFQILFISQIADEMEEFNFEIIVDQLVKKMVSRHPHVFPEGSITSVNTQAHKISQSELKSRWETDKQSKRSSEGFKSVVDDIPLALPALLQSIKLQKRASLIGLDWQDIGKIHLKILEELRELQAEIKADNRDNLISELGDVLFSCVNLARKLDIDPEIALMQSNKKFAERVRYVEKSCNEQSKGKIDQKFLDLYWARSKEEQLD